MLNAKRMFCHQGSGTHHFVQSDIKGMAEKYFFRAGHFPTIRNKLVDNETRAPRL